jgi:hypothetical protein
LHALNAALRGRSLCTPDTPTCAQGCLSAHDAWTLFAVAGEQAREVFRPAAKGLGIEHDDSELPKAHAKRLALVDPSSANTWMFRARAAERMGEAAQQRMPAEGWACSLNNLQRQSLCLTESSTYISRPFCCMPSHSADLASYTGF